LEEARKLAVASSLVKKALPRELMDQIK